MFKAAPIIASAVMALVASVGPGFAGEELILKNDEARVIRPSTKPATIVIGNPSIVDATMENGNLFVQGKAFGSTNMIILDSKGAEIANFDVTVTMGGNNNVALFKAGGRYTYTCAPDCQEAIQVGDVHTYTGELITLTEQKSNLAKGISNQDSNGDGGGGGAPPAQ